MKKNEIKITDCFRIPGRGGKKTGFSQHRKSNIDRRQKAKIFNSMPTSSAAKDAKPLPEKKEANNETTEDDDSDWGAVPAFLRRSKK